MSDGTDTGLSERGFFLIRGLRNRGVFFKSAFKSPLGTWNRFVFGGVFPYLCAALSFASWVTGRPYVSFVIFTVLIIYVLLTQKNILPLVPVMSVLSFMLPSGIISSATSEYVPAFAISGGLIFLAFVFYFIKRRPAFKKSRMLPATAAFSVFLALSGLFSPYFTSSVNLGMTLPLAAVYMFCVIVLFNCADGLTPEYFSRVILAAGFTVFLEMAVYYIRMPDFTAALRSKTIDLGWGNSNSMAPVLAACVPAAFYLASARGARRAALSYVYTAVGFIAFASVFFTLSRGALFALLLAAPFVVAFYIFTGDPGARTRRLSACAVSAIILTLGFFVFRRAFSVILERLVEQGFGDSGRMPIYREAWEVFKKFPLFGAGHGYPSETYTMMPVFIVHNTVLQFLASGGVAGTAAAAYFYGRRYLTFYENWKPHRVFLLITALIWELHGMTDGTPFMPFIALFSSLCFIALEKDIDADGRPPKLKLIDKNWNFK